jgi:hypothetical protein
MRHILTELVQPFTMDAEENKQWEYVRYKRPKRCRLAEVSTYSLDEINETETPSPKCQE